VKALYTKKKGLTRDEIIEITKLSTGGGLTDMLLELEESGFIAVYDDFSGSAGRYLYQLIDCFSLFYLTFMAGRKKHNENFWADTQGSGAANAWIGYAFERLCLSHVKQIKAALGIAGVASEVSAWRTSGKKGGGQIDLIIDRRDGIIDLCEMKYTSGPFAIDKSYAEKLTKRAELFRTVTGTKKALHTVMVTSDGIKPNSYSHVVQFEITLDELFR
jgi:hypothetical protein